MLAELARRNIEEGAASPRAARDAGVKIALGSYVSLGAAAEIQLMIRHGLTPAAAASTATQALDPAGHIGTVAEAMQGRRPADHRQRPARGTPPAHRPPAGSGSYCNSVPRRRPGPGTGHRRDRERGGDR
jgi:imidazolonepropionase-like amidohydrolase